VELFVMDDGWLGGRVDDSAGLGDWWPNASRFPNGLAPLIAEVHRLGMRFGIWVEPELRLRGLDASARYVAVETGTEYHGAVLLHHGLAVDLPSGDYASACVHLRRS
jgi:alpha-galactosidase